MIDTLLTILLGVVALLGAGGTFWGYRKGKKDADNDHATQDFNEYVNTRKRMDDADQPSDDDVADWLRDRGAKSKRPL